MSQESTAWIDEIAWTTDGLVPAVVQDAATGTVLMFAWMTALAWVASFAVFQAGTAMGY